MIIAAPASWLCVLGWERGVWTGGDRLKVKGLCVLTKMLPQYLTISGEGLTNGVQ